LPPIYWYYQSDVSSFRELLQHQLLLRTAYAAALLAIASFLTWQMGRNEFSRQSYYRSCIARAYLDFSDDQPRNFASLSAWKDNDVALADLTSSSGYGGPYHLFNAALDVFESDTSGSRKGTALPFMFTPGNAGFQGETVANRASSASETESCYRPTR